MNEWLPEYGMGRSIPPRMPMTRLPALAAAQGCDARMAEQSEHGHD